ncbi:ABC transporter substrate-binding protein [Olegusella massiliensis]|uniref:ABC transporter substrate-binding protein n=1 Tax=Olegusella massiliensis TaxID=1776381 RepID=UPI0004068D84|nr:ABC transporter substrate-binding protein [Olegusella massiliensis]MBS5864831.1 ABC transporter substrate-binding protein [Coriobacteriaceae bacterium]
MSNVTRKGFLATTAGMGIALGLAACGGKNNGGNAGSAGSSKKDPVGASAELIDAAKKEGSLVVYVSCEEDYGAAVCNHFQELYGIETSYQRLSTEEVEAKIEEEKGKPSGDVWFGGTTDPYNVASSKGLLEKYDPENAKHLIDESYKSTENDWYGIYKGILGIMYNKEELERLKLDAPKDYDDLLDEKYKGLVWMANYNTSGTALLFLNTMIQKKGSEEAGIEFLKKLDKNIAQYTKSGSGPSKSVGTAECTIGIGMLHDAIYQIVDNGYDNIGLQVPSSGASYEIGATAMFAGCAHPNAAKLWLEYALSPECVGLAQSNGSYQFLVIDDVEQPKVATEYGLDPDNVMKYDFEDAKQNSEKYKNDLMQALGGGDDRFKTE